MPKKTIRSFVAGAGGFIGSHLVSHLRAQGHYVVGADLKKPRFSDTEAHQFHLGDLRELDFCRHVLAEGFDEVYQLAADMGGAGYLFTGENDFNVMHHSAQINLNMARVVLEQQPVKVFFSSSACIYPRHTQTDPAAPDCRETSAYPADPDSEYGWEKLFGERLYQNAHRNYGLDIRIGRFHNVYGPGNDFNSGKEKAPAAVCRKVAEAEPGGSIEIWGSGKQTRSFLFIEDCIQGIRALMNAPFHEPVNIGSEQLISLNDFAQLVINLSGKDLTIRNVEGPEGVMGRTSDNTLMHQATQWQPVVGLEEGIRQTYQWINNQVHANQPVPR